MKAGKKHTQDGKRFLDHITFIQNFDFPLKSLKFKKQKIAIKDIPNIPPRGFVFIVPGPTNHLGEFFDISNNPLFEINHNPTSPPCKPIHPHKEFLSFNLIRDNKIPNKNNPVSMLSICKKGKSNPI